MPVSQDFPAHTGTLEFQLYSTAKSGVDSPFFVLPQIESHKTADGSSAAATAKAMDKASENFHMWIIAIV